MPGGYARIQRNGSKPGKQRSACAVRVASDDPGDDAKPAGICASARGSGVDPRCRGNASDRVPTDPPTPW
jgi:hypothetical protein